jgi:hypothetical protein
MQHLLVSKRTILESWYTSCFFKNKTFLFVKIETWNFQHLFDLQFHEILQNFKSFRQHSEDIFMMGNKSCPNELKFCEISRNPKSNSCWKFQLSILTNKTFLFLKKCEVYKVSRIVLLEINRWPLYVLTFLILGFG